MHTPEERRELIEKIRALTEQLEAVVAPLTEKQLTTHFIPGEWTVAQAVHHLADAHMNSYIRMKQILTQDDPPLSSTDQDAWAGLPDAGRAALDDSIMLLKGLHHRWAIMLEGLSEEQWARRGVRAERGPVSLDEMLTIYGNHGEAHLAQIARALAAQS